MDIKTFYHKRLLIQIREMYVLCFVIAVAMSVQVENIDLNDGRIKELLADTRVTHLPPSQIPDFLILVIHYYDFNIDYYFFLLLVSILTMFYDKEIRTLPISCMLVANVITKFYKQMKLFCRIYRNLSFENHTSQKMIIYIIIFIC